MKKAILPTFFAAAAIAAAQSPDPRTMRLSFVTASVEQIRIGIAALGEAIREQLAS